MVHAANNEAASAAAGPGTGAAGAAAAGAAAGAAGAVSCLLQADNMAAEATAISAKRRVMEIPFMKISLYLKEKERETEKVSAENY